jgi:hypothetical protein
MFTEPFKQKSPKKGGNKNQIKSPNQSRHAFKLKSKLNQTQRQEQKREGAKRTQRPENSREQRRARKSKTKKHQTPATTAPQAKQKEAERQAEQARQARANPTENPATTGNHQPAPPPPGTRRGKQSPR